MKHKEQPPDIKVINIEPKVGDDAILIVDNFSRPISSIPNHTEENKNILELQVLDLKKINSHQVNGTKKEGGYIDKLISYTESKNLDLNTEDKESLQEYNQMLFKLSSAGFNNIKVIQNCFRLYRKTPLEEIIAKITLNDKGKYEHVFLERLERQKQTKSTILGINLGSKEQQFIKSEICDLCEETLEKHVNKEINAQNLEFNLELKKKQTQSILKKIDSQSNSLNSSRKNSRMPSINNINELTEEDKKDKVCLICERSCSYLEIEKKILLNCKHFYCEECLNAFLKEEIFNARVALISCPNRDKCSFIFTRDIIEKILGNNEEILNKYDKFVEREKNFKNKNSKTCPIADCEGFANIDGLDLEKIENVKLKCNKGHWFCVRCMEAWHDDKTCEEYQNNAIVKVCSTYKIKRCYKCLTFTQKNEGCNHMTCVVCKAEWCWLCEKEYKEGHYNMRSNVQCYHKQFWDPDNPNGPYGEEPLPPEPLPRYETTASFKENFLQYLELYSINSRAREDAHCCEKFGKMVGDILFSLLLLLFNFVGNIFHGVIMHKGLNYLDFNNVYDNMHNEYLRKVVQVFYVTSCCIMWSMGFINFLGTTIVAFVFSNSRACIVACCRA